jgi:hypothetical protein
MISKTDSILLIYSTAHIRVKVYLGGQRFQSVCGDAPSDAFFSGCDSERGALRPPVEMNATVQ